MINCDFILGELSEFVVCEKTTSGLRVSTHCLYPSFEQVGVYIVGHGEGFIVHDDAGAARSAGDHGISDRVASRKILEAAKSFNCHQNQMSLEVSVPSKDWLVAAITTVANASASAAHSAVGKDRVSREVSLIKKAKLIFDQAPWKPLTKTKFEIHGESGKLHRYDLSVQSGGNIALFEAVISHPASLAHKYLAFADTHSGSGIYKYALHKGDLEPEEKNLISNVADLISIDKLGANNGENIFH